MSYSNTLQSFNALPSVVQAIGRLNIKGLQHPSWFFEIQVNGNTHHLALNTFTEIMWWYRPQEIYDDRNNVIGYKKKFAGDVLQRSYSQIAKKMGVTKRRARYACQVLKDLGLIRILVEKRVVLPNGDVLGNVPYIEPIPEAVAAITYDPDERDQSNCWNPHSDELCHRFDKIGHTNTKESTKIPCTVVSEIAESDSVVPVGEDKIAQPIPPAEEQEKKQILQELKSLILWNPVLQKLVDTTEAAVLKEAAKVVKRKAKVDQPGGGFLTSVIRNIKAGITQQKLTGRTPSVKALNKMPPGAQIWLENEGYFTAAILERVYSETIECTIDGQWKEYPIDKVRLFPDGYTPPEHPEAAAKRQLIQQRLAELENMEIGALIGGYLGYGQMREIGFYEGMDTDAKTPSIKIRSVKFGTIESVPMETIFTPDMIEYGERIYCETDPETIPLTDETMHLLKRGDVVIVRNDRGFFYQFEITDMRRRNTGELLCNLKSQFVEFYISSDRVLIPI